VRLAAQEVRRRPAREGESPADRESRKDRARTARRPLRTGIAHMAELIVVRARARGGARHLRVRGRDSDGFDSATDLLARAVRGPGALDGGCRAGGLRHATTRLRAQKAGHTAHFGLRAHRSRKRARAGHSRDGGLGRGAIEPGVVDHGVVRTGGIGAGRCILPRAPLPTGGAATTRVPSAVSASGTARARCAIERPGYRRGGAPARRRPGSRQDGKRQCGQSRGKDPHAAASRRSK
jgi:hypothetical protein